MKMMKTIKTLNALKVSTLVLAVTFGCHSTAWAQNKDTDNSQTEAAVAQAGKGFNALTADMVREPHQLSDAEKTEFFEMITDLLAEEAGLAVTFGDTLPDVTVTDSGIAPRSENTPTCMQPHIERIDTIENMIIRLDDNTLQPGDDATEVLLAMFAHEDLAERLEEDEDFINALDAFIKDYDAKHPPRAKNSQPTE